MKCGMSVTGLIRQPALNALKQLRVILAARPVCLLQPGAHPSAGYSTWFSLQQPSKPSHIAGVISLTRETQDAKAA